MIIINERTLYDEEDELFCEVPPGGIIDGLIKIYRIEYRNDDMSYINTVLVSDYSIAEAVMKQMVEKATVDDDVTISTPIHHITQSHITPHYKVCKHGIAYDPVDGGCVRCRISADGIGRY